MEDFSRDEFYMREAIKLARRAAKYGEAPIGCVIVLDGEIIAKGYNRREKDGSACAHAEILAIERACKKVGNWRLCGAELYVTLEPCAMCAGACINSRINRVIFGASDEKAGSCGTLINLFELPYNHKPALTSGVLRDECAALLGEFFRGLRVRNRLRREKEKGLIQK